MKMKYTVGQNTSSISNCRKLNKLRSGWFTIERQLDGSIICTSIFHIILNVCLCSSWWSLIFCTLIMSYGCTYTRLNVTQMVTIRHIYDKHPYNLNVQAVLLNNKGIEQRDWHGMGWSTTMHNVFPLSFSNKMNYKWKNTVRHYKIIVLQQPWRKHYCNRCFITMLVQEENWRKANVLENAILLL